MNIFNTKLRPNIELNSDLSCSRPKNILQKMFQKNIPFKSEELREKIRNAITSGSDKLTETNLHMLAVNIDFLAKEHKLTTVDAQALQFVINGALKKSR